MTPKECYNTLLAHKMIEMMAARHMEAVYCETKEDALKKTLDMIPLGSSVSFGGSATLREMGMQDALKHADYVFMNPDEPKSAAGKDEVAHQALSADYFLMSANAISETGELVNIDGYGNRAGALVFGPKHVIVVAGLNKVEPDLESAIKRARTYAARMTLLIFKRDYASFTDLCDAAEKACSQLVVTGMSMPKGRIKVILVGESLGY